MATMEQSEKVITVEGSENEGKRKSETSESALMSPAKKQLKRSEDVVDAEDSKNSVVEDEVVKKDGGGDGKGETEAEAAKAEGGAEADGKGKEIVEVGGKSNAADDQDLIETDPESNDGMGLEQQGDSAGGAEEKTGESASAEA